MDNEIKSLITTFKEYRDLIVPIEQNLKAFSISFESISGDIQNLNSNFDGSIQTSLDKIYSELTSQADKAKTLASQVDRFLSSTNKYVSSVDNLISVCEKIENKLNAVNSIEEKAESQIARLDTIIEEKKKTYNIKSLEKNLENYNIGVEKISEYINNDVADTLKNNSSKIAQIQDKNNSIYETIVAEKDCLEKLINNYQESNKLLKKVVESNEVNEQYIFEILDKWAEDRRVKTKK